MIYNPDIFKWAREKSGLTLEQASYLVGTERLEQIEQGVVEPTFKQLKNMTKKYHVPFNVFYLKEPPLPSPQETDFRSLSESISVREQAILDMILSKVRIRQDLARYVLEEEASSPLSFVGSAEIADGITNMVERMQKDLDFIAKPLPKNANLFNKLRNKVESMGVFIQLEGGGNKSTKIENRVGIHVFRGFAITDSFAPFIVINSNDTKHAMSFTLIHELAHLYLGKGGISGDSEDSVIEISNEEDSKLKIEVFCNKVASQFLLPKNEYALKSDDYNNRKYVIKSIYDISDKWHLSRKLVLLRLFIDGFISNEMYKSVNGQYTTDIPKNKNKSEGGPNFYVLKQYSLGLPFINIVRQALLDNTTTPIKASKAVEVSPLKIEKLFEKKKGVLNASVHG